MIKPDKKVVGGVVSLLVFGLFALFLWHRHEEYMHTIYECQVNSHSKFLVMPGKKTITQFKSSFLTGTTTQEYKNCKERGDYSIFSNKNKEFYIGLAPQQHIKKDEFAQGCIGEDGTIYKKIPGMTICLINKISHIPCTKTTY